MKRIITKLTAIAGILAMVSACNGTEQTIKVTEVESIVIDQGDLSMIEGETVSLTATVLPEDAADKAVSWISSDEEVVMVSTGGKAMAMQAGRAVITAKAGKKNDFITITVSAKTIPVTGVSLNPPSITMKVGESQTVSVEITPQDATNKSVTWSSSNPEVASVDNGTVLGLKPGSVTITATTEDGAKTADCAVTVKSDLSSSVTVDADHISAVSAVLHAKANLDNSMPSDLMVGFQYSTSSGILPSNSVTIEASDADAQYNYSAVIGGLDPCTKYYYRSVVRQNGTDNYGETKEFTTKEASLLLETLDASEIGATKATLNSKLDLTDVYYSSLGYGFLWGQNADSQTNSLAGGNISNNAFTAVLPGLSHKTQYWYKSWVTLDGNTYYGAVKSFTTSVIPVTAVSLDMPDYTFHTIGDKINLTATVTPNDATDKSVQWSSDNTEVATVNSNGQVTAVGNGSATITVATNDQGKTATCEITVQQYVTEITLNKSSLSLYVGETETLSVIMVSPINANDKFYSWTSSDESIATINSSGKVEAVSAGTAQVRATANDGSGVYASCEVTVIPVGAIDLGLSVYWAACNLGADKPEDYGDYYAWGEPEPSYSSLDPLAWKDGKTGYNWASYGLCNGSSSTLTKYNTSDYYGTVDNKTVLELEDDAAHVNLGGNWRLPSYEEWTELITQCSCIWTSKNGVNGYELTGSNGNSIFLPAAGVRYLTRLDYSVICGYYMSSSIVTSEPYEVWGVGFNSEEIGIHSYGRYTGFPIRPVTE